MLTYIKTAIRNPKEVYIGRNMKNSHFFLLGLLVTLILTFIMFLEFIPAFESVQSDFIAIRESIPSYEIVEDELTSPEKSYIYQTNSMIFYFDPDDNITTEVIDNNMSTVSVPVSVGILKDQIHLNFLGQSYSFFYSEMNHFSTTDLQRIINSFGVLSGNSYLILLFILLTIGLFSYSYQLIIISLIASISNMLTSTRLRLFQVFKVAILANLMPILLTNLVSSFITPIPYDFEIIVILTLFIFFVSIKEMEDRMKMSQ